ncbi:TRIC cation channel family protein [Streptomyces sp. NRRL S-448]|uniref:TRIC cation channel family protein n=1 Tax=Streptomyces sp. NRRL S-448 TaxID=1463907 RepID=UPI0035675791
MLHALYLLGTAAFAASGVLAAHRAAMDPFAVLVLAVLTGVAGEVIRDVLCGEFPPLLLREEVYATAAFAGAAAFLALHRTDAPDTVAIAVSAALVFALRLAAIFGDLHLPRLRRAPR